MNPLNRQWFFKGFRKRLEQAAPIVGLPGAALPDKVRALAAAERLFGWRAPQEEA